jgi:hypothetical protein
MIKFFYGRGIPMNKKKMILRGITFLIGFMLTGCVGYYGDYGYREYPYDDSPYRSYNCPGDYGQHYCAR